MAGRVCWRSEVLVVRFGIAFVVAVVLAAVVAVGEPVEVGSSDVAVAATAGSSGVGGSVDQASSGVDVAASPASLPLPRSHFVGSVLYKRTVWFERFDTDHDIDGSGDEDREIFGSHYVWEDTFRVRIPASLDDKPEDVFGFSFNHIVFEVGGARFTADCGNERTYMYKDTSSLRWICSLSFGSKAYSWNSAIRNASDVKIIALWSDEECGEENSQLVNLPNNNPLLVEDCKALLAIKHYWLDEVVGNRGRLFSGHSLWSWGVGDINNWGGVLVGNFPNDDKSLKNECGKKGDDCSPRVVVVDLGVVVDGRDSEKIKGGIPGEFGDLKALVALNLYNNLLTGEIPAELGNDDVAPCHKSTHAPEFYLILYTHDLGEHKIRINADDCRKDSEFGVTSAGLESGELDRPFSSSLVVNSGGGVNDSSVSAKTAIPKVGLFREIDSNGVQTFNLRAVSKYSRGAAKDLKFIAENFVKKGSKVFKTLKTLNTALNRFALVADGLIFLEGITRVEHNEYLEYGRSQLKFLDLSRNALSGQIPASLGRLDKLRFLYLNDNYFEGVLPNGIGMGGRSDGTYDSLVHLDASDNQLSGRIPEGLSMALEYLDLGYNQLTGVIPWESIGRLPLLAGLYLNDNRNLAIGDIPEASGLVSHNLPEYPFIHAVAPGRNDNLNLTYLDLSNNGFGGAVPDGIFKFWGLKELSLNGNDFVALSDGSSDHIIGYWLFLSLRRLDLSDNNFSGIPGLGKLKRLEYFNFSSNKLDNSNDSLEDFLRNFNLYHLKYIDLSDNLISHVPVLVSFLSLTHLYFNDNCLVMSPRGQMVDNDYERLIEFDESNNYFNQTPANPVKDECGEIGDCENGAFVDYPVSQNELVGDCEVLLALREQWQSTSAADILSSWGTGSQKKIQNWAGVAVSEGRVRRVTGLDFSDLGITGVVPAQISKLDELKQLNLSSNKLSGDLPRDLADLRHLRRLDLSGNSFTSSIWDEESDVLFSLGGLQELDLSGMDIGGEVPAGLRQLGGLKVLDLSDNRLSGEIPVGLAYMSEMTDLDLSHNKLSGEIPVGERQGFVSVVKLDLSHNQFTGSLPKVCSTYTMSACVNFNRLDSLDFSYNLLTGEISYQYARLANAGIATVFLGYLKKMQLNNNCLTIVDEKGDTLDIVDILEDELESFSVENNPAGAKCPGMDGCSDGFLVLEPDENVGLVADCEILLELLEVWSGAVLDGWGTEKISDWTGVKVDNGRVEGLGLANRGVSGVVPAVIGGLSALVVLDLSGNGLSGGLPGEIGGLSALVVLDLSGNGLSGGLPSELGDLGRLEVLDLSGNRLRGGIPGEVGDLSVLEFLDLSGNRLSGGLPSGLGGLRSLEFLDLSGNRLSGGVPSAFGGLGSLTDLDLSGNRLSGGIPSGLGNLGRLEVLDLSDNGLSGEIPSGLGGLSVLERLWLRGNRLGGEIPKELGDLGLLGVRGLDLRDNCLLAPVPEQVEALGESVVRLERNLFLTQQDNPRCTPCSDGTFLSRFSSRSLVLDCFWLVEVRRALHGDSGVPVFSKAAGWGTVHSLRISSWSGVVVRDGRVRSVDLSVLATPGFIASTGAASGVHRNQKLVGEIPGEFANLWALESLDLSNNRFGGSIPAVLGSLRALESLDLSSNRLDGVVPGDLGDISGLESLDLSHNRLEGAIPEDLGQYEGGSKKLAVLLLNDNFLSGPIPATLGGLPLRVLHLFHNCLQGAAPEALDDIDGIDLVRFPNRKGCSDRCSDGTFVAAPQESSSLVGDCLALLAAREWWATGSVLSSEAHISRWAAGEHREISDWPGVEVDITEGARRVVGLKLAGNGLSRGIPEALVGLGSLAVLDLSSNGITDAGSGLLKLSALNNLAELDLSGNRLAGRMPLGIGQLRRLVRLDLSDNQLSGAIPSGDTPVPGATPLLNRLTRLEHLDLSDNMFTGAVPSHLFALRHLDLSGNQLDSRIDKDLFKASGLAHLDLSGNELGGVLPGEIYEHSSFVFLDLSDNLLSGTVKASFKSNSLARLDLSDNQFSGGLPGFLLAPLAPIKIPAMPQQYPDEPPEPEIYIVLNEGNDQSGYFASLTYLDLSGNQFSGPIPLGYDNFANGRAMERLDLSGNQITGNLPTWIKHLQFPNSDDYQRGPNSLTDPEPDTLLILLENNLLCTPQDYTLADLKRNNGTTAPTDIHLANNDCPEDDHASIYAPGPALSPVYERVGIGARNMRVEWQYPQDQTGLIYIVEAVPEDTAPQNLTENAPCILVTTETAATITSDVCEGFHAQHYTAEVTPVYAPVGSNNRYYGNTAQAEQKINYLANWQFLTVQQLTTLQAISESLALGDNHSISYWDGGSQRWRSYGISSLPSSDLVLAAGTTIATMSFMNLPADADLVAAKLGSADSDTPVLLRNGWNMIPAGGNTARPEGDEGAWFLDSSLVDCRTPSSSSQGAIMILRYKFWGRYDLELPCHPTEENSLTYSHSNRNGNYYDINEIQEYDNLFIYYRSATNVRIIWKNGKYVPFTE